MLSTRSPIGDGLRVRSQGPGARRVLVLAGGAPPGLGTPATATGQRASHLATALAAAGHDVTLLAPQAARDALAPSSGRRALLVESTDDPADASAVIRRLRPHIVVAQGWEIAATIDPTDQPLIVDLLDTPGAGAAPFDAASDAGRVIAALARADLVLCAGERQRMAVYPWLLLAGFDLRAPVVAVVPPLVPPEPPPHPALSSGRWARVGASDELADWPELAVVAGRLAQAGAAVALIAPARGGDHAPAVPPATVEALWHGRPVLLDAEAELARTIVAHAAGWAVDLADPDALAVTVDAILADPAELARRARNAQRLARERFAWDRAAEPLVAFCREPFKRQPRRVKPGGTTGVAATAPAGDLTSLAGQVEALALQSRAATGRLETLAQRRLTPPRRLIEGAKALVKTATGLDRRLVLAEHGATLAGDLAGGASHGQSFVRGEGWLYQIDLLLATYGRLNPSRVHFHLCAMTGTSLGPDLVTLDVSAARLLDNRYHAFIFPPLAPAPGQVLACWLASPDATAGTTIAVWMTTSGLAAARQRFQDGRPVSGALLFRLHERVDETLDGGLIGAATGAAQ